MSFQRRIKKGGRSRRFSVYLVVAVLDVSIAGGATVLLVGGNNAREVLLQVIIGHSIAVAEDELLIRGPRGCPG